MKLYGKRSISRRVDRRAGQRVPERDAIIWSVNLEQHYCYVKIQGSNTQIKAHYPANWNYKPYWLKPGNAVRIRHRAGNRGYIEVIGEGRAIPSPVSGDTFPALSILDDAILTGMTVKQTWPTETMAVTVDDGTYRISGVVYTFDPEATGGVLMDDPANIAMTAGGSAIMGDVGFVVQINDAPVTEGKCRYDILVVGTDGEVDYIKGEESDYDTEPTLPSTPANHLFIEKIFVTYGMETVGNSDIGKSWVEPNPMQLTYSCACEDCVLDWSGVSDYPTCVVTLTVADQYGEENSNADGRQVEITMYGTGTFKGSSDGSYHDSDTKGYGTISGSTDTFTYKRDQTESTEASPTFVVRVLGYGMLVCIVSIRLGAEP